MIYEESDQSSASGGGLWQNRNSSWPGFSLVCEQARVEIYALSAPQKIGLSYQPTKYRQNDRSPI